jgi:phage-related protein
MSFLTYIGSYGADRQAPGLAPRRGEVTALLPARLEAGWLLRRLQAGEKFGMPHSRPMPAIGPRCHELRVVDAGKTWRLVYRIDADAVVIVDVFQKTTAQTPARVLEDCRRRLRLYDAVSRGE